MDAAEEIFSDLQDKAADVLKPNASADGKEDSEESHDFDLFDNSFMESNSPEYHISSSHVCKKILYLPICEGTTVRAWDVLLFLPNLAFIGFLIFRWSSTKRKLLATNSPIFRSFHFLVALNSVMVMMRGIVAMMASGAIGAEDHTKEIIDKSLWICTQTVITVTEVCVLAFGLAGTQLDSKRSIFQVSILSIMIVATFTLCESILEFSKPDSLFDVYQNSSHFKLFGYGGSLFNMVTSYCFATLYAITLISSLIPCTKRNIALPNKPSFYQYCGCLLLIHLLEAIGSGLMYFEANPNGLCLLNLATFLYVTGFTPIVYITFLSPFFKTSQPTLLFAYKAQLDDGDEEENAQNSGSMQFSLTQGSVDLVNEENEESPPIIRNDPNPMPVLIDGLASPDSVTNDPIVKY